MITLFYAARSEKVHKTPMRAGETRPAREAAEGSAEVLQKVSQLQARAPDKVHIFMLQNKIWDIIKSDCPSVRLSVSSKK